MRTINCDYCGRLVTGPEVCCGVSVTTIVHKLSADWPTTTNRDLCSGCAEKLSVVVDGFFTGREREVIAR